jgi:hypothetical protein
MSETTLDGTVFTALVTNENGCRIHAAATATAGAAALASYCRANWSEAQRDDPAVSKEPPIDDEQTITDYFAAVHEEYCDRSQTELDAVAGVELLEDGQLASALAEVGELTRALSRQRATLAQERIRRLVANHKINIKDISAAALALPESLPREIHWELEGLLNVALIHAGEQDPDTPTGSLAERESDTDRDQPWQPPSAQEIRERIMRELPRLQFRRRVRWSVAQLERIAALNQAAEGQDSQTRELRNGIAENTRRLIVARRAPASHQDAGQATTVQVAYLMGVEVLVDLEQRRVTRVVVIDESIELDVEEGAREQTSLASLPPARAADAVAIAESPRVPWPAPESGF